MQNTQQQPDYPSREHPSNAGIADFLLGELRSDWEEEIFANQNCRIALIRRDRLGKDHTDKSPVRT